MNLKSLNLVELDAQEVQEVEGGNWFYSAAAYLALEIVGNPNASWKAFQEGYNSQF